MDPRPVLRSPALLFGCLVATSGCDKLTGGAKPTMTTAGTAFEFSVPKKVQARIEPKLAYVEGKGIHLTFDYTGFPDGAALKVAGAELPLKHIGSIDDAADVNALVGAVAPGTVKLQPTVPVEVTFSNGKHVFDLTIPELLLSTALEDCLRGLARAPCVFPGEPAANAKPNIAYVSPDPLASVKIFGSPATVRDIDWVAVGRQLAPKPGKRCKMVREGTGVELHDTFDLSLVNDEIQVFNRRTGAKLKTQEIEAADVCPTTATINLDDPKSGLKSEVTPAQREAFLDGLRGEGSAAPAKSVTKPKKAPRR